MRLEQAIKLLKVAHQNKVPTIPGTLTRPNSYYNYMLSVGGDLLSIEKETGLMSNIVSKEELNKHSDWVVNFI